MPIVVYFAFPKIVSLVTHKPPTSSSFLIPACFLFFISWYLPSPNIEGHNTAFVTHFVGGGIFCGLLWLHICKQMRIKPSVLPTLLAIFALTATLGTINELLELALTQTGIVQLTPVDTWWDLLANTLGGLFVWIGYCLHTIYYRFIQKNKIL